MPETWSETQALHFLGKQRGAPFVYSCLERGSPFPENRRAKQSEPSPRRGGQGEHRLKAFGFDDGLLWGLGDPRGRVPQERQQQPRCGGKRPINLGHEEIGARKKEGYMFNTLLGSVAESAPLLKV